MSTTKPPAKPSTYFIWGLLSMALLATLIIGLYMFTGGMVSSGDLKAAREELQLAQAQILTLEKENQNLKSSNLQIKQEADALQASQQEKMEALNLKLEEMRQEAQKVNEVADQEEEVQFVARRTSLDFQGLARQINEVEGLQVKVLDSGLLISGMATPFRLGSSEIKEDSLIPKLKDIAAILKDRQQETGTRFYAAAVGNTDITPVRSDSLWGSNLWLGAHRARTLADLMIENGFPKEEVFLVSWGSIQASDEVRDPESRRPEILIVTKEFLEKSKEHPPSGF